MSIFTNCKGLCRHGGPINEDFVCIRETAMFVIDGASSVVKKHYSEFSSDAQWLAVRLGNILDKRIEDLSKSIANIVSVAVSELFEEYCNMSGTTECEPLVAPSACLSVLRLNGDILEYFALGDCTTLITDATGSTAMFLDETVPKLDKIIVDRAVAMCRNKGIPYSAALAQCRTRLTEHRKLANSPNGYWILDLTGKGIEHATTAEFPVANIDSVAILSDGFADIVSLFDLYSYSGLMQKLKYVDPEVLFHELRDIQESDDSMLRYPRLNKWDDAGIAWANIT